MILLTVADFVTYFSIPVSVASETEADLQVYIDRFEKYYIVKLLGATLGELFIADLANASQAARFVAIQDEFYLDNLNSCFCGYWYNYEQGEVVISRGMVDMLKGFIFYEYVSASQTKLSQNGVTISIDEGGTILSPQGGFRFAEKKFNECLLTFRAIQWYIRQYAPSETDYEYPEFNGTYLSPRYSPIL